jgi:hypothetical protein
MTDLPTQIRAILRRYSVLSHWRSARDAGKPSYAIWADGKQIGEPMKHREAQDMRETMIANDIAALIVALRPIAQPNWERLGFAGIEDAEGRN